MLPVSLLWAAALTNEPAYPGLGPLYRTPPEVPAKATRPKSPGVRPTGGGPGGLPPEVWTEVFAHLVPPKPVRPQKIGVGWRQGEWFELGAVRLVCRDFDAIVSETRPEVATRLASALGRRFLRRPSEGVSAPLVRWLGRARSVDLTLSLLAGQRPQHDAVNALLAHAPNLRRLRLTGYRTCTIDAASLRLERVPLLKSLEVEEIQLGPAGWFGFCLQKLPDLNELVLADIGPVRSTQDALFCAPASLEVLSLTEVGLTSSDLPALQLHRLTRLRVLKFDGMPLHDGGFAQLTKLALPNLKELRLRRAGLTGRAFRAPDLTLLPRLRVLDLAGNVLGEEGADAFDLSALLQLRGLDLSNNRLGNQGLIRLRGRVPKQLAWVEVGHNGISLAVARAHEVYPWPGGGMAWRRDQLFAPAAPEANWLWRWLLQVLAANPTPPIA